MPTQTKVGTKMMQKELPQSLYEQLSRGHLIRTGHALIAHLESETGELWYIVRECCGE